MSSDGMSRAAGVLRSVYQHVQTLDEFADGVVFKEGQRAAAIEESDTDRFKTFVQGIYVCRDQELTQVPSCSQICTLPELMAFILNSMKRKKKRNILVNGYNIQALPREMRNADQFQYQGVVTQSACYIQGSDLWRRATARLGTDVTRYLLESCTLFVAVPPSCVFQVCGAPVHDRVSMATASPCFHLQARSGTLNGASFARYRRAGTVKRPAARKKRSRTDVRAKKRKRKGGTDQEDEEGALTRSNKRRRVGPQEVVQEIQPVCSEAEEGGRPASEEPTPPVKPLKGGAPVSKHRAESQARDGAAGWRSGMYPPPPPTQSFIRTLGILYGRKGMNGFLLNRKVKCADGRRQLQGQDLIRIVFFEGLSYLNGLKKKPKKLPRRFFGMAALFGRLLRQHRRCPYRKILQRMCPLPRAQSPGRGGFGSLLSQRSAPHRVYLFIRECLCAVIPEALWGSHQNRLRFLVRIRIFLHSGKFERLSVAELLWKMKVNDCDWLKISQTGRVPPSELAYRTRILGQFLAWLLDGYVGGLVRALFYVTESLGQKNALRFYKHDVWEKLEDLAFRGHLSKGQLEELTPAQVASLPKSTIISRLRFIPKIDGMRPITRVAGAKTKDSSFRSHLNQSRVRDLFCVLRACVNINPSLLGSTVWGMAEIHNVLRSIAPSQKETAQPLYFVKVDVSGAYESLPHKKLIEVIDQALSLIQDKYFTIRCYSKIWADSYEGLKKTFVRRAYLLEPCGMKGFVMSLQDSGECHHAVLAEQRFCSELRGKEAKQIFIQMLTSSVVQFGKKTYRQCRGIPQGSVISSLLCCLCYGHMENVLFKDMMGRRGCLMRLVDDFLLITPDLYEAEWFLDTLLDGVPEYGLVANPQKVAVNFPLMSRARFCPSIRVLAPRCLFPWCGLLLDSCSLDVYKDYSSYAGMSVRYSLTLGSSHSAGQQMKRKLMAILRLKCHALFLDMKTNSLNAVYKNIYELLLLHAHRFHVCAQSLPFGQTVAKNPAYFLQIIWHMAEYTNHLLRISNKGRSLGNKALTGVVQYEAVELLFCLAFWLVLSKHRRPYRDLLRSLQKRKRRLEQCLGDLRLAMVRQAANPRTAVDFLAKLK
ncbi:telomerase reverse transcriptase [Brachionichthys hirsutus]|uniref:telomerase reverse transcriptase n=1 Tax=Brachionichthys hirsutus TaxID=412623 RepID=UPI0036051500